MPAYLIGHISIKDPVLWADYVDGVAESLKPFAGEVVFRGRRAAVLAGEYPYDLAVVIRFVDQDRLQSWFLSPAYQALITLRDRASDLVILAYDEV